MEYDVTLAPEDRFNYCDEPIRPEILALFNESRKTLGWYGSA